MEEVAEESPVKVEQTTPQQKKESAVGLGRILRHPLTYIQGAAMVLLAACGVTQPNIARGNGEQANPSISSTQEKPAVQSSPDNPTAVATISLTPFPTDTQTGKVELAPTTPAETTAAEALPSSPPPKGPESTTPAPTSTPEATPTTQANKEGAFVKPSSFLRTIPGKTTLEELSKLPGIRDEKNDPKSGTIILTYDSLQRRYGDKVIIDAKSHQVLVEIMDPAQMVDRKIVFPSFQDALNTTKARVIKKYDYGNGYEFAVTPTFSALVRNDGSVTSFVTYTDLGVLTSRDLKDSQDPLVRGPVNAVLSDHAPENG